jgi:hypothetical protein
MKTLCSTEQALKVKGYRYQLFRSFCPLNPVADAKEWLESITKAGQEHDRMIQLQLATGCIYLSHPKYKVVKRPVIVNIEQRHGYVRGDYSTWEFHFNTFIFIK